MKDQNTNLRSNATIGLYEKKYKSNVGHQNKRVSPKNNPLALVFEYNFRRCILF